MATFPRPAPRPQLTGDHQAANPPLMEKGVDREAKRLHDKYTRAVNRTIRTSLPDGHRQRCEEYVADVHVYKALLVDIYAHLVHCEYRDKQHPLLIKLQQSVSIWRSWDRLKQLTHHVKIRDTLNGYLQRDCQKHSQPLWARSHVPEGDKDGILSLIVHCGRAQETAFYDLAYRRQIQEDDDHILWKESDVLIDLLHSYLTIYDIDPIFRERLLSHTVRLARKSTYLPKGLAIDFGEVSWSGEPLTDGSTAGTLYPGSHGREIIVAKWLTFNDERSRKLFRKAFSSEAILWSTLRHVNIVSFYGVVTHPESPFRLGLVYQFMPDRTITDWLKEPSANRKKLAVEIAKALKYIHNLKPPVYHGDLKCDNIVVDTCGHACLTDFLQASDSRQILDLEAVRPQAPFQNTVQYIAPEWISSHDIIRATSYSDMWSFGCVLYKIVTGRLPFEHLSPSKAIKRIRDARMPTLPRDLEPEFSALWPVIESCWHLDPKRRLSAHKAVDELS